ncbi:hypothetical protein [Kitasatospora sp. NPDC096204]|uniref:hypothetical protein n=1 Tax=Kitasatospora sp. NPDC096204 TaxID=3364094 RepID=UPI00382D3E2E
MNPHDPLTHPGAHLVYERLGAGDAGELSGQHPYPSPMAHLASVVASCARDVDRLHQDLTERAQTVIERLQPVARGDHASMRGVNGIIQSAGLQVELLTARRGAAYEQLDKVLSAYERGAETGRPPDLNSGTTPRTPTAPRPQPTSRHNPPPPPGTTNRAPPGRR